MAKIENFEELDIWKSAVEIAVQIYELSDKGKLKNDFGLKDQIRRSAISISSNIAEGFEKMSKKELVRYLKIAKGSCGELRSQLFIVYRIGMIEKTNYEQFYEELIKLSKQINAFIKYLQKFIKEAGK